MIEGGSRREPLRVFAREPLAQRVHEPLGLRVGAADQEVVDIRDDDHLTLRMVEDALFVLPLFEALRLQPGVKRVLPPLRGAGAPVHRPVLPEVPPGTSCAHRGPEYWGNHGMDFLVTKSLLFVSAPNAQMLHHVGLRVFF